MSRGGRLSLCAAPCRTVTIGPVVLLCFLGITFSIGSKTGASRREAPARNNGRRATLTTSAATSETSADEPESTSDPVHPPSQSVPSCCVRKIFRRGAGDASDDVEQVLCVMRGSNNVERETEAIRLSVGNGVAPRWVCIPSLLLAYSFFPHAETQSEGCTKAPCT